MRCQRVTLERVAERIRLAVTMANSAARIAEIRAALSSTGKSVSNYSARFAAGEVRLAALSGVCHRSVPDSWT